MPLATITRDEWFMVGSSSPNAGEANCPLVLPGPGFEYFKCQASQNMDGVEDVRVEAMRSRGGKASVGDEVSAQNEVSTQIDYGYNAILFFC